MNSYIVRIYRRDATDSSEMVGTVEPAEHGERKSFRNLMELWTILSRDPAADPDTLQGGNGLPANIKLFRPG